MLQGCLEQFSSVTGEQFQIESPEPFQGFLEPRTLPLEESFQSDIPTGDRTTREEVGMFRIDMYQYWYRFCWWWWWHVHAGSAESQTESDNESDNEPVKSAVEQQKFIVFGENR